MAVASRPSRRRFIGSGVAAAVALALGLPERARSSTPNTPADRASLEGFPSLDGAFLLDDASRDKFSFDTGRNIQHVPLAVLKPGSIDDVVRAVKHANRHRLRIAMRGQGHSTWGQSLVEGGLVIDSGSLRAVTLAGSEHVDVQAGATWSEVNQVTLAAARTPPVMPNTMITVTVGGILSAGGIGETSHRFGAIVDAVDELEVVTGEGRLVTCSPRRESELFNMVLAGMGQCAMIMRARLRLERAPDNVIRQNLVYHDFDTFFADARRVALDGRFDYQELMAARTPAGGRWTFTIRAGKAYSGTQVPRLDGPTSGMAHDEATKPISVSYWDYLLRESARNAVDMTDGTKNPRRRAALAMFLPISSAKEFVAEILASSQHTAGLNAIFLLPVNVRRCTRPLLKLPDENAAFSVWLSRRTAADAPEYTNGLMSYRAILERMRAMGGKHYSPYSTFLSPADWKEHYGPDTWQRLSAAKRTLDPGNILTPGPNMF